MAHVEDHSVRHDAAVTRSFRDSLLAMLGIGLVNMLVALDQTVVSTALPSIVADLKGAEYYAWIASVYLLASVVSVPIFGRLGDYFGRKRFVIASIITFTVASALCGLASNVAMLVFARALQGIGGGMMVGTAFAAIPDLFPDPHTRVRWQVVMAGSYGIATAAGPFLGGFLSAVYGWRATFLINLPVGLAGLYCVIRYLPHIEHDRRQRTTIDWTGAALLSVMLASLQMGIERLPTKGLASSTLTLVALAIGSCVLLYRWEKSHAADSADRPVHRPQSRAALRALVRGRFRDVFAAVLHAIAAANGFRHDATGGRHRGDAAAGVPGARQPGEYAHRHAVALPDDDRHGWLRLDRRRLRRYVDARRHKPACVGRVVDGRGRRRPRLHLQQSQRLCAGVEWARTFRHHDRADPVDANGGRYAGYGHDWHARLAQLGRCRRKRRQRRALRRSGRCRACDPYWVRDRRRIGMRRGGLCAAHRRRAPASGAFGPAGVIVLFRRGSNQRNSREASVCFHAGSLEQSSTFLVLSGSS